jgi:hypothetical protein
MRARCSASRIVLTLGFALCTQILMGCWERITLNPEIVGNEVVFRIVFAHANGLLQATVWEKETRKTLWDINLAYYKENTLRYGEVPKYFMSFNGAPESAKQDYPDGESALPIPRGKDIILRLIYSFSDFPDISIGNAFFKFRVESDGTVVDLEAIPWPAQDKMYDRFDARIGR